MATRGNGTKIYPTTKQLSAGEGRMAKKATTPIEQEDQEVACLTAIKAVHATGPTLKIGTVKQWQKRTRGGIWITQNVSAAKFSRGGRLLGFYREDQRRGKPNRNTSTGQAVIAAFDEYKEAMRSISNAKYWKAALGRKSGEQRRKNSLMLRLKILRHLGTLSLQGIPTVQHAKLTAKKLNCSVEHVCRVRRSARKQGR